MLFAEGERRHTPQEQRSDFSRIFFSFCFFANEVDLKNTYKVSKFGFHKYLIHLSRICANYQIDEANVLERTSCTKKTFFTNPYCFEFKNS